MGAWKFSGSWCPSGVDFCQLRWWGLVKCSMTDVGSLEDDPGKREFDWLLQYSLYSINVTYDAAPDINDMQCRVPSILPQMGPYLAELTFSRSKRWAQSWLQKLVVICRRITAIGIRIWNWFKRRNLVVAPSADVAKLPRLPTIAPNGGVLSLVEQVDCKQMTCSEHIRHPRRIQIWMETVEGERIRMFRDMMMK